MANLQSFEMQTKFETMDESYNQSNNQISSHSHSSDYTFCCFCNKFFAKVSLMVVSVFEIILGAAGVIGALYLLISGRLNRIFESSGFLNTMKQEALRSTDTTKLYDNFYFVVRLVIYSFLGLLVILQLIMGISLLLGLLQGNKDYLQAAVGWKWIVLAVITLGAFWFTFDVMFSFSLIGILKLLVSYLVMIFHAFVLYQLAAFTEIVCKNKVH